MAELNCQMHVKTATDYNDIYLTSKSQLVEYDNTISGLSATDTKSAIDELAKPTKILDVNGNEMLKFSATANAVNEVGVYNNGANSEPGIYSSGNDTNIAFGVHTKGTGNMLIYIGNYLSLVVSGVAGNIVNRFKIYSNISGQAPTLGVEGVDTNIDIVLSPKGTGGVIENKVNFTEATTLANIVSGESNTTLWGKVKKMFSFIGTDISKLASAYSASSTYGTGAYVTYNNKLYRCTTAITVAEAWNIAKWTESNFSEWSGLKVSSPVVVGANLTLVSSTLEKIGKQVFVSFTLNTTNTIATNSTLVTIPIGYRIVGNPYSMMRVASVPNTVSTIQIQGDGNIILADSAITSGIQVVFMASYFTT